MPSDRTRILKALGRLWVSFWKRRSLVAVKSEHDAADRASAVARGRFWSEFREGQREAEAHSSRPR